MRTLVSVVTAVTLLAVPAAAQIAQAAAQIPALVVVEGRVLDAETRAAKIAEFNAQ